MSDKSVNTITLPTITFGFDIDDSINLSSEKHFPEYAKRFCNKKGLIYTDKRSSFYIEERFGFSTQDAQEFADKYLTIIDTTSELSPEVLDVMYWLKNQPTFHAKFIFITARSYSSYSKVYEKTEQYLKQLSVPFDKLVVDVTDKLNACLEHGVDIFLDDNKAHCAKVASAGHIITLLRDQPYNQDFDHHNVSRIKDLHCIKKHIPTLLYNR